MKFQWKHIIVALIALAIALGLINWAWDRDPSFGGSEAYRQRMIQYQLDQK